MINSITLLGSSSGRNAGDAALIHTIMDACDKECQRKLTYEIPTINPKFVKENYPHNTVPVSIMPWNLAIKIFGLPTYRSILRTDFTLIFDAVLFDRSLYNPLFNFLSSFYTFLLPAKKKGKQYALFDVGLGPVNTPTGKKMLREVINGAEFVTVRDQGSADVVTEIGADPSRCLVTADAALNCPMASEKRIAEIFDTLHLDPSQEILAVNVNKYLDSWAGPDKGKLTQDLFIDIMSKAINNCLAELQVPLLLVSTQHHDLALIQKISKKIRSTQPVAILDNRTFNHVEIKGVLSKVTLLFGMRLHAMILGSSALTPIVGLAYQPKCSYYFDMLGLGKHIYSFNGFSDKKIFDAILCAWEDRDNIRDVLRSKIPYLQKQALIPAEIISLLSRGESIDNALQRVRVVEPNKPDQIALRQ